jgi:hypothetical protein
VWAQRGQISIPMSVRRQRPYPAEREQWSGCHLPATSAKQRGWIMSALGNKQKKDKHDTQATPGRLRRTRCDDRVRPRVTISPSNRRSNLVAASSSPRGDGCPNPKPTPVLFAAAGAAADDVTCARCAEPCHVFAVGRDVSDGASDSFAIDDSIEVAAAAGFVSL